MQEHFAFSQLFYYDTSMRKYTAIAKAQVQRGLTYRFTIFMYRVGELAEMVVLIMMWTAIYGDQSVIKGFTLNEMVTYILAGGFVHALVRNFLADVIATDIKDGNLSLFLVKPMGYLEYIFSREVGRMSVPTAFSALSLVVVALLFWDSIIFSDDVMILALFFAMIALAFVIELLLSFLVGLIAFWTDEVNGLHLTIERLKKFLSGGYFPLSLLPVWFVNVSLLFPFAYSFYVPAQLYLGKMDATTGLHGILVQIIWIVLLYGIIQFVWRRGLRKYEGVGI